MPDLDFDLVALNKKQMLSEFIKCHSAFREEEEEQEGTPSRSGNNRGSSNRGRAQQYVQEDSYGEEGEQPGPRSGNRNLLLNEHS